MDRHPGSRSWSWLFHICRGILVEYRVIRILSHLKVLKNFEKIIKIRKYQKMHNLKKILVDSELTRIYRPISCIMDSNQLISAESELVIAYMIICAIRGSISYHSLSFRLRLGRYYEPCI